MIKISLCCFYSSLNSELSELDELKKDLDFESIFSEERSGPIHLWITKAGMMNQIHYDGWHNIFVQLWGRYLGKNVKASKRIDSTPHCLISFLFLEIELSEKNCFQIKFIVQYSKLKRFIFLVYCV
jgi:hypothetical protein